ncbi:MAG: IS256 family transposase, partial [Candidatus Electrothrix sp. ATG1]|nr:IS256 family transposase [Candidatus Electrothrix sp. ATG1]
GRQLVVRNGYLPEREIQAGIGPITVKVPKVRDKSRQGLKFNSSLLPRYLRKTKSVKDVFAVALSQGDLDR